MALNHLKIDLFENFGGLDNLMYIKKFFGAFHWNHFLGGYIWLNVNLTWSLTKYQPDPKSDQMSPDPKSDQMST